CTPSATICAFRRGDSCLRRNGIKEIPAFAGMAVFLFLRTIPNLAVSENIKNHHSGESRNLIPSPPPQSGGKLYAFGDSLRLSAMRFRLSPEWRHF
ncbi:MAG: hypothetical protein ACR2QC_07445, partial [Gammaproteobacteria bacterium]